MNQFVCVRLVQANAMDLTLFQFDFDLTFAVILMNADGAIYGRYGTRTRSRDAEKDVSLEGLAATLSGALELHKRYPDNKAELAGKQPVPMPFKKPDSYPSLAGKYATRLDYGGKVVQSCLHCHQIREAERAIYRSMDKPMPDQVFFPYPTADVIGLELDLRSRGTVSDVHPQSPAAMAGFDTGDILLSLNGQPIISHADVQWVLHHAKDTDELTAVVDSKGKQNTLKIPLHLGWREGTDISWRATTWDFRRMGSGGLVLEALSADECEAANIEPGSLALRVQYVGEYGEHAVGKRAGFQKDDIIISIDGRSSRMTESQWLAYAVQRTTAGQTIPATVLRNGQRIELSLMMQK